LFPSVTETRVNFPEISPMALKTLRIDPWMVVTLTLGLTFCLYGSNWGRVESWNPDQMALRPIFIDGKLPFQPGSYHKPPFHTYLNFFLAETPARVVTKILGAPYHDKPHLVLFFSRLLTAFLFLGSIALVYLITREIFDAKVAKVLALLFSTTAGIVAFAHFLTADVPVLFWMLLSFYFAQKIIVQPSRVNYLCAGFLTGLATATKYNGLAIGIAIVMAHFLSRGSRTLKAMPSDKNLIYGLTMVPIGFIIGNPYSILDYQTFVADFLYNYQTTPVYSGNTTGHNYGGFLRLVMDIVGLPVFAILLVALLLCVHSLIFRPKTLNRKNKLIILLLTVVGLYYLKFGSFPRLEDRFVLPIVPYLFIFTAVFWEKLLLKRILFLVIFVAVLVYNSICSFYVGKRFLEDPRMEAQIWAVKNLPAGVLMVQTPYVPRWEKWPGTQFRVETIPLVSGRKRLFEAKLAEKEYVLQHLNTAERNDDKVSWYSLEKLQELKADFIAVDSFYYARFIQNDKGELYPSIRSFFIDLLAEEYPYRIVFDRRSKSYPRWLYPRTIKTVEKNRMVILAKTSGPLEVDSQIERETSPAP
jgi:hypothetical protein